jgi:hypothetical protein
MLVHNERYDSEGPCPAFLKFLYADAAMSALVLSLFDIICTETGSDHRNAKRDISAQKAR